MNDEILQPIEEFHAADLRRALNAYQIKMPKRATKKQLYDRLLLAMRSGGRLLPPWTPE
jgi:hypothetical protein